MTQIPAIGGCLLWYLLLADGVSGIGQSAMSIASGKPIPVILDTDIGDDIDDTWALAMLLKSPQFDIKLITTTNGQAEYRARLIAKILTIAQRIDIPIGLGPGAGNGPEREKDWIAGWRLEDYHGAIHRDGAAALIETINKSDPSRPISVIAIGPLQTLAAALQKDPSIAEKANFVGMQGSVFRGYAGSNSPQPEFNIKTRTVSAQRVLSAHWKSITITPLDTCGVGEMKLAGAQFESLRKSDDPLISAILESYAVWSQKKLEQLDASTVLFDTVAIYLADPTDRSAINLEKLNIAVTDDGLTIVSQKLGRPMQVATSWKSLDGFKDFLLRTLLGTYKAESK